MELTSTVIGARGLLTDLGAEHGVVYVTGLPGAEAWKVTVGLRRSAHGTFWPAMLALRSHPDPERFTEVTSKAIRKLCVIDKQSGVRPLDRLLAVAVATATLGPGVAHRLNTEWVPRRRGGGEPAFSRLVAMIYAEAVAADLPPRHVVAAVWSRSLEGVNDWIRDARQHGALGRDTRAFRPKRAKFVPLDLHETVADQGQPSAHVDTTSYGAWITHVPGSPGWQFRVELRWDKDRSARCRGLVIEPAARGLDLRINAQTIASLPLAEVIEHGREAGQHGPTVISVARLIVGPLKRDRGREHSRLVAQVYRFALSQGVPPLQVICAVWNRPYKNHQDQPDKTVSTWTRKAREDGFLPEDVKWSPRLLRRPRPRGRPLPKLSNPGKPSLDAPAAD
ncbi:hypothetical protein [Streptomyces sp. NPDC093149]|uniref:hypothetical protein n=1 Tax=Streptomyces sp. NPDC093149 TaxID=3366031 RepID=UPI003810B18B